MVRSCAVGHEAPDFELATSTGEKIKLSSLRGKYVLWISGLPGVVLAGGNSKYKKVYANSRTKDWRWWVFLLIIRMKAWKKALEEEKLDYLQLSDPKS